MPWTGKGWRPATGATGISHASVMSPVFAGYDPKVGAFPARDLAKAKAKMAEAGYPGGGGLKVTLATHPARPDLVLANQVLKANLADIGIESDIEVMAQVEFLTRVLSQEGESRYQILLYMTPSGNQEIGFAFNNFFHSKGARNNLGPYSNPQVDQLIERARSTYDQKERVALYQQAATMIREDVPVVPIYIMSTLGAVSVKARNYVPDKALGNRAFTRVWLAP